MPCNQTSPTLFVLESVDLFSGGISPASVRFPHTTWRQYSIDTRSQTFGEERVSSYAKRGITFERKRPDTLDDDRILPTPTSDYSPSLNLNSRLAYSSKSTVLSSYRLSGTLYLPYAASRGDLALVSSLG